MLLRILNNGQEKQNFKKLPLLVYFKLFTAVGSVLSILVTRLKGIPESRTT